jgi:hypothetical protein
MVRELEKIRIRTNATLDHLLAIHSSPGPKDCDGNGGRSIEERRTSMTKGHEARVKALIDTLGPEEAIRAAREALYTTGLKMGKEARTRLGVGESRDDLVKAAGIMYRILGIEFSVVDAPEGSRMEVTSCALSREYSHGACLMLSAVDEGVVSGLNSKAGMCFTERITGGSPRCVATITIKESE